MTGQLGAGKQADQQMQLSSPLSNSGHVMLQHRDVLYVLCDGQLHSSPRLYIKHINEAHRVALLFERNTNLGVLP